MSSTLGPIAAQRARNARLTAEVAQIAAAHARAGADRDGRDARPLPVVLLPANTRSLVPLPAASRDAFLASLDLVLARAMALPLPDEAEPTATDEARARADAGDAASWDASLSLGMVGGSCGTCGGACCTAGGTHAFLKEDSLRRIRAQRAEGSKAEDTPEAIRALYVAALPAEHYRDSCVFHARDGCTLSRGLRSNLCNRYQCGGLTQLSRALTTSGARAVYVGAADATQVQRVALVSEEGALEVRVP